MHTLKLCFSLQLSVLKMPPLKVKCEVKGVGLEVGLCKSTQCTLAVKAFRADSKTRPGAKFTLCQQ